MERFSSFFLVVRAVEKSWFGSRGVELPQHSGRDPWRRRQHSFLAALYLCIYIGDITLGKQLPYAIVQERPLGGFNVVNRAYGIAHNRLL